MMYEMSRRKTKPPLLTTQGIFNLQHHDGKWPLMMLKVLHGGGNPNWQRKRHNEANHQPLD